MKNFPFFYQMASYAFFPFLLVLVWLYHNEVVSFQGFTLCLGSGMIFSIVAGLVAGLLLGKMNVAERKKRLGSFGLTIAIVSGVLSWLIARFIFS